MTDKTIKELLEKLHTELAKQFLREIEKDDPAPSALNAARQFLKDNDITAPWGEDDEEAVMERLNATLSMVAEDAGDDDIDYRSFN